MDTRYSKLLENISYYPNDIFSEKGHGEFFRLYFFEKGAGIASINGKRLLLVAPCCLCLNEAEDLGLYTRDNYLLHTLLFNPVLINSAFSFDKIHQENPDFSESDQLDLYWLKVFLERDEKYGGLLLMGPSSAQRVLDLLEKTATELDAQKDSFWPCRSRSFLFELFNVLNTIHDHPYHGEQLTNRYSDELVDPVAVYLNEYYHTRITIAELTERFGIDRTSLSEKFSKSTGMTIIEYLTKVRIRMACLMLIDTILPVSEIQYRVGYEDSAHFGRVFKKETGCTPSFFRKKNSTTDNMQ